LRRKGVWAQDMEDVHQSVLVAAIECLPSAGAVRSMEALLATLSLRHAADQVHRRRERPVMEYDGDTAAAPPSSRQPIPRPDSAYALKEQSEALDAVLDRMDPELVDVFILVELVEMTLEQAAEALGISTTTARSRLRRARVQFEELCRPARAALGQGGRR